MLKKIFGSNNIENFQKELLKDKLDLEKIQKFLDKGIDINQKDERGRTILFTLVDKRKIEAIKILLKNKADLFTEDIYGKNVLDEAISKQDGIMIRFLIDNGFNLDYQNSSNRTTLQDVALEGDYRVFEILTTYNPNFDLKDSYGKTVLFDAVNGENTRILKEVINNIEDINTCDDKNQTALFLAVLKEDIEISQMLVSYGISLNHLDEKGQNVLFNAILRGDEYLDFIYLLIKKDININQVDKEGRSILDEILHILELQRGSVKNLEGKYDLIIDKSYEKITSLLIANDLNVDKRDSNGNTILENQIEKKNYENIDFLIRCGADVNIKDKKGRTVLYREVLKGNSNHAMIKFLVERGANIETRDDEGYCIYDCLVEAILINGGYKQDSSILKTEEIQEDGDYIILLKKMLTFNPKLDYKDKLGRNILFRIVDYNDYELITSLINYGVNLNEADNEGKTPIHILVENGLRLKDEEQREEFIKRLVFIFKFRVDVNTQDHKGRTVYHKAVIANDLVVLEKMLTKKANLKLLDRQGKTALHHTKWTGNYKIARLLIAAGADMNQVDSSGFSLLNYAACFGHLNLILTLLKLGVLMYNKNIKNKKVALFLKQKEEIMDKLLLVEIKDAKLKNALEQVVENTKNEINDAIKGI